MLEKELIQKVVEFYRQQRSRSQKYQFMFECWQRYGKIAFPLKNTSEKTIQRILNRNAWDIRAITGKGPLALTQEVYELPDGGYALVLHE